jgi:hypothetical protein
MRLRFLTVSNIWNINIGVGHQKIPENVIFTPPQKKWDGPFSERRAGMIIYQF